MRYRLASEASTVTVRTGTEGLFARMAHRLELVARPADGWGERAGEVVRGGLRVRSSDLHVTGALRGDRVDVHVLAAADVSAIDARVAAELFGGVVTFEIEVDARIGAAGGTASVSSARGKASSTVRLTVEEEGESLRVTAEARLSLRALGAGPVSGPLGAFRVADELEVTFRGHFIPEAAGTALSC
jgi:hypothetical protein